MSTGTGARLAQEIYDEFLICKICFDVFKHPKSLDCLHTFCEKCIENQFPSESSTYKRYTDYKEFSCPLCYKRTSLPASGVRGLPDNFTVSGLLAVIGPQCPDASKCPSCDVCKRIDRKYHEATAKCLDCVKLLCAECVHVHREVKVTSGHSLYGIHVQKDVQCKEHPDEAVRFYCLPCDACICVLCTFNQHLDHEVIQFADAVADCRQRIAALLGACKVKASQFSGQAETLDKCEEVISSTARKIKDAADKYVEDVQSAERKLLDELQQIVGPEVIGQLETKKDLMAVVEGMRSTCDIADIVLLGKDIELLLLKKDVEEKLTSMNSIQLKELSSGFIKNIEFYPGAVDFGYLCDRDSDQSVKKQLDRTDLGSSSDSSSDQERKTASPRRTSDVIQPTAQNRELAIQTEGGRGELLKRNSGYDRKENAASYAQKGTMTDDQMTGDEDHLECPTSSLSPATPTSPRGGNQLDQNDQEPRRRRRREIDPASKAPAVSNFSFSQIKSK